MKKIICPFTGVNAPRLWGAAFVGFIFVFASDFLVHGILLTDLYESTSELWRPKTAMKEFFPYMVSMQFFLSLFVMFIFTRNYEEKGIGEGVRFGVQIGLVLATMAAASYAWLPIPFMLAVCWGADAFLKGVGLGLIVALIYRK